MPDKRCPNCKRWNSDSALICDCGFNFTTGIVPEVPVSDRSSISSSWRFGMTILGLALIPGFILSDYLTFNIGRFSPLLVTLLLEILIIPLIYWFLYFTSLEKSWSRYLMLIIGLLGVVLTGFVAGSFIMRFIYPQ